MEICCFLLVIMTIFSSIQSAYLLSPRRCADDQYQFNSTGEVECRQCTSCPPGYGAVDICTPTNDTLCLPCAEGTYSSSRSPWNICLPCKTCAKHQLKRRECSNIRNGECKKACDEGYYYDNMFNKCYHCNYCYQNTGEALRIPECMTPGVPEDYQCMIIQNGRQRPFAPVISNIESTSIPTTQIISKLTETNETQPTDTPSEQLNVLHTYGRKNSTPINQGVNGVFNGYILTAIILAVLLVAAGLFICHYKHGVEIGPKCCVRSWSTSLNCCFTAPDYDRAVTEPPRYNMWA